MRTPTSVRVSRLKIIRVLCALSLTSAFSGAQAQDRSARSAWPVAAARSVGLNQAVLDSLDSEIASGRYGFVDRLLVIRHGKVAFDKKYSHNYDSAYADSAKTTNPLNAHDFTGPFNYFNPWWHPYYRRGELHTLQSVTKTIASLVFGIAITRGDFPSIETPALRFFDTTKVANIDDRKRRMTVRHLLTMTGGIAWTENLPYIDPNNTATALEASPDWVSFTINRPMAREPGTLFNYSSGESALLAHVFRQGTGVDLEEYASRHLFAPLGIDDWFWKRTPSGSLDTEGGLYLEARDLARIWYLVAQDGRWNNVRIVSADWIRQSITPSIATSNQPNAAQYGFLWWLYPDPVTPGGYLWSGSGFGGQIPMVFPTLDMVVVFNGWNILPGRQGLPLRAIQQRLAKAVVKN